MGTAEAQPLDFGRAAFEAMGDRRRLSRRQGRRFGIVDGRNERADDLRLVGAPLLVVDCQVSADQGLLLFSCVLVQLGWAVFFSC